MEYHPDFRLRRVRKNPILRSMVSETRLSLNDLIYPIFVKEGIDSREEVRPMPGIHQLSVDALVEEAKEVSIGNHATIIKKNIHLIIDFLN